MKYRELAAARIADILSRSEKGTPAVILRRRLALEGPKTPSELNIWADESRRALDARFPIKPPPTTGLGLFGSEPKN